MRNTTSRALRATATVAGVAALGATFAGTALANSGLGDLGGNDNSYGSSDSHGLSGLGDSDGSSIIDEPGLANFEMPGMGMGSRGFRTSGSDGIPLLDALDGDDDNGGYNDRYDDGDMPQHPVDNEGGNFAKNISFLGHDSNSSYRGKSIGSRSFRTSDDGNLLGGDSDYGDSEYGDSDYGDKIYHRGGSSSRGRYGDDSEFGGSGDGLSGHTLRLPLGT